MINLQNKHEQHPLLKWYGRMYLECCYFGSFMCNEHLNNKLIRCRLILGCALCEVVSLSSFKIRTARAKGCKNHTGRCCLTAADILTHSRLFVEFSIKEGWNGSRLRFSVTELLRNPSMYPNPLRACTENHLSCDLFVVYLIVQWIEIFFWQDRSLMCEVRGGQKVKKRRETHIKENLEHEGIWKSIYSMWPCHCSYPYKNDF